jgi:hypothetical protein
VAPSLSQVSNGPANFLAHSQLSLGLGWIVVVVLGYLLGCLTLILCFLSLYNFLEIKNKKSFLVMPSYLLIWVFSRKKKKEKKKSLNKNGIQIFKKYIYYYFIILSPLNKD